MLLRTLSHALAWLGRQGTRAVAASLFLGLALPPLAGFFKPVIGETIFAMLVIAFVRVDLLRVRAHLRRPALLLACLAWMMAGVPLLVGIGLRVFGVAQHAPGLDLALALGSVGPPIMSAPAFAYLLGLEGALSLTLLVLSMAVTPVTAPLLAGLVAPGDLPLSGFSLGLRLFTLLAGSLALAAVLRRLLGPRRTEAAAQIFDGLNVVLLFIFAVALMDGVAAHVLAAPALTLGLTALAFAAALGSTALTALLFRRMGFAEALSLGLAVGHRNLGLMIAATGGALPDLAWLYFAVAQFPIYLSPQLVRPLAQRILRR